MKYNFWTIYACSVDELERNKAKWLENNCFAIRRERRVVITFFLSKEKEE